MIFVTVDNDSDRLRRLSGGIFEKYPGNVVCEFTDPMLSVKYICNNEVDIVLAREEMCPVAGTVLKKVVHRHKPELPVILF